MATLQMGNKTLFTQTGSADPTLDENGMLVFDGWPLKPRETE